MKKEQLRRLWPARLALAVCGAAFLAAALLPFWAGDPRPPRAAAREAEGNALSDYLTDRNALRREEIAQLLALAAAPDTSAEIREAAQRRALALREYMAQEANVEAVLAARGCPPLLVTVSANAANVLVQGEVSREEAAMMLDAVSRETGLSGGGIRIIPIIR